MVADLSAGVLWAYLQDLEVKWMHWSWMSTRNVHDVKWETGELEWTWLSMNELWQLVYGHMSTLQVPPFLQLLSGEQETPYIEAVFAHKDPLGHAHSLWWSSADVNTVVLFIPGNPGLAKFYTPFLSTLHAHTRKHNVAILAHSLLGHAPLVKTKGNCGLSAQVQGTMEAISSIKTTYPSAKLVLVGHSAFKNVPDEVHSLFLLFPTISNIGESPNGRRLQWAFRPPAPYVISKLSYILRLLPLSLVSAVYSHWPREQINVLLDLLNSPSSIFTCLSMAHEEMNTIRRLETEVLAANKEKLHFYFADHDNWVGKEKEIILRCFDGDPDSVKIVHGRHGIPHAFCINHGEELGKVCANWISRILN
ncbi:hypothetical protein D9758_000455 [Tetrapyrgos nigripes]|uniref:Lipid droplet-associated hydrolase n=1 Tax=Tetrapyrgos nigripes TaxID=182062 RepID=A0A8H5H1F7_9AGAR|nr:hypothetical protein D9758_000455 [Tetrapyrgos nigripes]